MSTRSFPSPLRLLLVVATGWTLAGSLASAKELPGRWIVVSTPNFRVVSNAPERTARKISDNLERIHAAFQTALPVVTGGVHERLTVFAPSDERGLRRLLPGFWENRSGPRPAGVFSQRPGRDWIVLQANIVDQGGLLVVHHEYFHYVARRAGWRLPRWLAEGLADFWGSAKVNDEEGVVEVGRPLPGRIMQAREGVLLPLERFLSETSWPRTHNRTAQFYAQSWLLTHYLLVGDPNGERSKQLREYWKAYEGGVESVTAAVAAFGDLRNLDKALNRYRRAPAMAYAKIPIDDRLRLEGVVTKLSSGEAAGEVVRFLVDTDRLEEATELVGRALEGAAGSPLTQEAAGLVYLKKGEPDIARRHLTEAIAHDPASPIVLYALAVLDFEAGLLPSTRPLVEERLSAAIAARPTFTAAKTRLARFYALGGDHERALGLIRLAVEDHASLGRHELLEVQYLEALGRGGEAESRLARIEAELRGRANASEINNFCWTAALQGFAARLLSLCKTAHELEPDRASITDTVAFMLALAGHLEEAERLFRQAVAQRKGKDGREFRAERSAWADVLATGVSPFAGLEGRELREKVDGESLEWGY